MRGQSGFGMSSRWGRIISFWLIVLNGISFTNFASHPKISNFADTHLVHQHVLQLDVSVDVSHGIMKILEASDDLPEHYARAIVWEAGATVALEDVVQRTGRAVLGNEVVGEGGMFVLEERQGVLVVE